MKRWLIILLSAVLILALVSSCATGKGKKQSTTGGVESSSRKSPPAWITDIPETKDYFYFVGTGADAESFDAGKKSALSDALSQVVGVIGIMVTSTSTYEERYFAEQYTTTIASELFSEGRARLQDTEIDEIYYEERRRADGSLFFRVWVLVKYSKQEIDREQKRLEQLLAKKLLEVEMLEQKASELRQKGLISDAIVAYLNACIASLRLEDGEVYFDRNIRRAGELLTKVRLEKSGESQTGWVGECLQKPLVLRAYYLEDEQKVPVQNMPVRFAYRVPKKDGKGYKYEVVESATDSEGNALFSVGMVHEVGEQNRVDATVDFGPHVRQLRTVPKSLQNRVKTFRDILSAKKTTFVFRSDTHARKIPTGMYFLQLDENGEPVTEIVTASSVYDVLYGKDFSVSVLGIDPVDLAEKSEYQIREFLMEAAGGGVKRVLFGRVRITEYGNLSGYEMARADAAAVLIDARTGDVLRTWKLARSSTGGTRESAARHVFEETGKALGELISNTMP